MTLENTDLFTVLTRIADGIDKLSQSQKPTVDLEQATAYVWDGDTRHLKPVPQVSHVPLRFLTGIDRNLEILAANTKQFAQGFSANNALLWGARGMGKSSLVKAIHADITKTQGIPLTLVELYREDIPTLSSLLDALRHSNKRILLFCDDLSFDSEDQSYKSLKALLDGGVEGRPENVLFYATSNRRHLMKRDMIENEKSTAIHPGEAVEEKVSLSDRFGLWLGFHACSQDDFFKMIKTYADAIGLQVPEKTLIAEAREWQVTRGSRSGRVAWQFIQDMAGRHGLSTQIISDT